MSNINQYQSSLKYDFDTITDPDFEAKRLAIANYLELKKLDNSFLGLNTSFSVINTIINKLDASFQYTIETINTRFANIDISLQNYDISFIHLIADVVDISGGLITLGSSVTDISIILHSLVDRINNFSDVSYVSDASFQHVIHTIIDISNRLNNVITNGINNGTSIEYYVNDVSQTFYEIITQQPYMFAKENIIVNSSSLILKWNYDSIIAKHENANIAKLAFSYENIQNLPFIHRIILDISGFVNNNNSYSYNGVWLRLDEINVIGDYNKYDLKHYIFERINYSIGSSDFSNVLIYNIINNNLPFSIRVYGENYSNNYPDIETRALIFDNLRFLDVNRPSKPIFIESNVFKNSSNNNINLTYYNNLSEDNNVLSSAYLTEYIIDYSLNDSLTSYTIGRSYKDLSFNGFFPNNIDSSSNFDINIANLLSGTNYYHNVKVKNNFSSIFSEYSDLSSSKYTLLPNNNNVGTAIDMSIKDECYKYVSNSYLDNSYVLYFNINNLEHAFKFNTRTSQEFQITYPYFHNQQLESNHYGYGKFIDNCNNLVAITLSIDNTIKHSITYGGYNLNGSNYLYSKYDSTSNFFITNNVINIQDIYENDVSNKGFRLKGYVTFNDAIANTNLVNYFGVPSVNPYIMAINYSRVLNTSLGSNVNYNIYIDNLIGLPVINNSNNNIYVQEIIYNMSVPSVKYFRLVLNRTYSNINSVYKYIVANKIIANFSASNIFFNSHNIVLTTIAENGVYNYNDLCNNDLCYNNIAYNESLINIDSSFHFIENVYNLNGVTNTTNTIVTNHYCDYASFNKSSNIIESCKLNLNFMNVYEISNIGLMKSDLNNIVLKHYNNHQYEILPCSLLYVNSYFNNNFSLYPNISAYNYDNLDVSYNDTYGNISYDLSGYSDINNQGYKWIVFKIFKNTNVSNAYIFNNNSYNIEITNDGNNIKYLPLKNMLKANNLFTDAIVDRIFDITNNDALMFGHATTIVKRFFNVKQTFNPIGGIWSENSYANTSYNNTASNKAFGSNVYGLGIYCPINNLNNDLTIYIGLKNST